MKRSGTIGLVLLALLPVVVLAAFLFQGGWGKVVLTAACGLFPVALYLVSPGPARPPRVFPWLLGLVLLVGLAGLFRFSAVGRGGAGLVWMILFLWLLPLVLVSAFHAVFDRDDGHRERVDQLRRRFGNREEGR